MDWFAVHRWGSPLGQTLISPLITIPVLFISLTLMLSCCYQHLFRTFDLCVYSVCLSMSSSSCSVIASKRSSSTAVIFEFSQRLLIDRQANARCCVLSPVE